MSQTISPAPPWIHPLEYLVETTTKMEAFQVMHVSLALYSDVRLPRKCDYQTDTKTNRDRQTRGKVIPMCWYDSQVTQ